MQQIRSVLFLSIGNSARSQMAEGLARSIFESGVRVKSAGSAPTALSPFAVQVMDEIGISIGDHTAKHVGMMAPRDADIVVSLCAEENCPIVLSAGARIQWTLAALPSEPVAGLPGQDPEAAKAALLSDYRATRDTLRERIGALNAAIAATNG